MKTYAELTESERKQALEIATSGLLDAVVSGAITFNDDLNGDNLQSRIDAAIAEADAMQTPWFAGEIVLDVCRAEIESMALCNAEDSVYRYHGALR